MTCSNRSAAGERDDTAGPALVEALRAAGWDPEPDAVVVPDDEDRPSPRPWRDWRTPAIGSSSPPAAPA